MPTEVLRVDRAAPNAALIGHAAEVLRRGRLVAFPTETVYGLGANALDPAAVGRIFAAKARPAINPIIVHIASIDDVPQVASMFPAAAKRLAERFWPGPLTLVLPRRPSIPDNVCARLPTVGIRVPAHPVARALIEAAGVPIAAPSANRSSRVSPTLAVHVLHDLAGRFDILLDAGPTQNGLESTVVDMTTSPPRLLRPGPITPAEIEAVVGSIARGVTSAPNAAQPSPGMLPRHYAPGAPLECAADNGAAQVEAWRRRGQHVGWLTFAEPEQIPDRLTLQVMPREPAAYAVMLYAVLHALEEAGVQRIVVEMPPESDAWLAVRDRLRRASTPAG